ncbi:MAG: phosphatidylglycerol lysyltransferase domain-containing protein [Prevotellaceae bacterium]|nr:phosphatidylglycerol lysyltransferase domain-containing protein [Prevotellaceae bacterium]
MQANSSPCPTLVFRDVAPEYKALITSYTFNSPWQNCDLSFSNLCSWRFMYNTLFAEYNGFLILKFKADNELAYMYPVGQREVTVDLLRTLQADAAREGEPLRLMGLCQEMSATLERIMPGQFRFEGDRDFADYLYLRTDLATLAGKKLQPKRNHVNKFMRTYPYDYAPLTSDLIHECLDLEAEWCKQNHCDEHQGMGFERRAMVYALFNYDALGLSGGILRVDGNMVAFTFGVPINRNTFGIHVEKADTHIEGAYAMINKEFASHIPEQYTYLNREEDLGIEGLRKAKLSYQPVALIDKGMAILI